MKKSEVKILIVDSPEALKNGYARNLQSCGYAFDTAISTDEALRKIQGTDYSLVLTELRNKNIDGLHFLQRSKSIAPYMQTAVLASQPDIESAVKAIKLGAIEFLEKPVADLKLRWLVNCGLCISRRALAAPYIAKNQPPQMQFDGLVGQSDAMQRVYDMIQNVAESEANVLITGESGTGKELVARSVHARSQRSEKSFVPINCSALPENLFEAELFGYEKGAFTGANQRKLGLLEFAHNGSFFLDEVVEMPVNLQAKLLRVLQDKKLRHLGGNELIPVEVRLISASNRDLQAAMDEGILRQDFYFRLNVVNIHLPPLRERPEDIPLLVDHFLYRFLKSSAKTITGFDDEVVSLFECYAWPGNVRELENIIERAITLARGSKITLNDLPPHLMSGNTQQGQSTFGKLSLVEAKQKAIDEVERKYLLALLSQHNGNVTKIAEEAGMTRRNLHRLLNRHRLDANAWRMSEGKKHDRLV